MIWSIAAQNGTGNAYAVGATCAVAFPIMFYIVMYFPGTSVGMMVREWISLNIPSINTSLIGLDDFSRHGTWIQLARLTQSKSSQRRLGMGTLLATFVACLDRCYFCLRFCICPASIQRKETSAVDLLTYDYDYSQQLVRDRRLCSQ